MSSPTSLVKIEVRVLDGSKSWDVWVRRVPLVGEHIYLSASTVGLHGPHDVEVTKVTLESWSDAEIAAFDQNGGVEPQATVEVFVVA
jgi:kynureninase